MRRIYQISISNKTLNDKSIEHFGNEINELQQDVHLIKVNASKSFGLSGGEQILTIVVSFATSIAANATYDFGKEILKKLKSNGLEAELLLEEE